MLTLALYGLLAIALAVAMFAVAAYVLPPGERIAAPVRDEPIWELPRDRELSAEDVATVRLPVALRGYRFAETDALLDRLTDELKARDALIARLRGGSSESDEIIAAAPESAATPAASGNPHAPGHDDNPDAPDGADNPPGHDDNPHAPAPDEY